MAKARASGIRKRLAWWPATRVAVRFRLEALRPWWPRIRYRLSADKEKTNDHDHDDDCCSDVYAARASRAFAGGLVSRLRPRSRRGVPGHADTRQPRR